MKHPVCLILALVLCLSLIGCLGPEASGMVIHVTPTAAAETESPVPSPTPTATPTETPTETPSPAPAFPPLNDNSAAYTQTVQYGSIDALHELYETAAEIGSRYGVYIYIADVVPTSVYAIGDNKEQFDPDRIRSALDTIDRVLAQYPNGYFDQLLYDKYVCTDLYIVGFCPTGMAYVTSAPFEDGEHWQIVLDAEEQHLIDEFTYTLPHEITHLADWRLTYVSETEPGHLFSEDRWMELNPQGFSYAYGDQDKELAMYDQYFRYFTYSYGAGNPLEDRATLFSNLFQRYFLGDEAWTENAFTPECCKKLEFYLACLRDGFDTTGWPEETSWEAVFRSITASR